MLRSTQWYRDLVGHFRDIAAVVVGDVCLDRYVVGKPTRLSREAPVPVLEWVREYCLPGGASNPALNIASLGASGRIVAVTGTDPAADELRGLLESRGAGADGLVTDPERVTTEKTRVLAEGLLVLPQQIARIDRVDPHLLTPERVRGLCGHIERLAPQAHALLVSDYKGGVVCEEVIGCVRGTAARHGKLLTVDSQGSLYRFAGFDYVKSNRADASASLGRPLDTEEDFQREMPGLRDALGCRGLIVTRDAEGISYYSEDTGYGHVPAIPVQVADVVGAGDTVIAVLTLALAAGASLDRACYLANAAAALVVQHVGNAYPAPEALLSLLDGQPGA